MGSWMNLDKIDLFKFRKPDGYVPEGYHGTIQYFKDGQFLFPTKYIHPLNWRIIDNMDILKFFNGQLKRFDIDVPLRWVNKYSFLPGPGEIRPTHILFRYDVFPEQPVDTPPVFEGDFERFAKKCAARAESQVGAGAGVGTGIAPGEGAGDDHPFVYPAKQVVLKSVNPNYGFQEYQKQKKLVELGFATPRVYHYETYFSPIMLGFLNIINQPRHVLQKQCRWAYNFIIKLEHNEKTFGEFKEETRRFRLLLEALEEHDEELQHNKQARKNLARYKEDFEDLSAVTDNGKRVLKGYFTMDYWGKMVSFERILFDLLGGRKLETYSRSVRVLETPPVFEGPETAQAVVDVITRLWNLGVTHNDLKGEHVVFNGDTAEWGMIDWGELTPGTPGKDLALFLKDSADFIRHRVLFNRRYLRRTFRDKWGEHFDSTSPHFHKVRVNFERVSREIFQNEVKFWHYFLDKMAEKVGGAVLREAVEIGEARRMKFNWNFVRDHING